MNAFTIPKKTVARSIRKVTVKTKLGPEPCDQFKERSFKVAQRQKEEKVLYPEQIANAKAKLQSVMKAGKR